MLERLRAGLKLVGQEPSEQESFFHALEKLHSPVLKLRARTRHATHVVAAELKGVDAALLSTERQKPPPPAATPWLTPTELQAAGFDEERSSGHAPLDSGHAPLDSGTAPLEHVEADGAPDVAGVIAGLHQGAWVDLYAREHWLRANLKWVSGRNTLFMFVSHGGQPHTMTRRSLEKLVRQRHLRAVDHGAVVPRALDALSQKHEPAGGAARRSARPQEEHAPA